MASKLMVRSAFYCVCGYGQLGDLTGEVKILPDGTKVFPPEASGWDGKTYVEHAEGAEPVCPNLANHASSQELAARDRLAALEAEVAKLKGSSVGAEHAPAKF